MKKAIQFLKKDPVLAISGLAAVITMFLVPPSPNYISYIDLRVIVLLFCLMVTVAGLRKTGLFDAMAKTLLAKTKTLRQVVLILMLL
ncbi:MAG: citrate transporter, partial [Firmicutes bacterium]|nr:citrate transporter [Bacillota bacterium]